MNYLQPVANAMGAAPFGMTQENWDITKLLIKIGVVSSVLSIPVGIWAIKKWPEKPIIPAAILTALGLAVKEVMISRAGHHEPLASELETGEEQELAGFYAPAAYGL